MTKEFDEEAFRKQAEKAARGLFERTAAQAQEIFDAAYERFAGKTAEAAALALKQAFAARRLRLSRRQLNRAAQAIAENRHIALTDARIRAEPLSRRLLAIPGRRVNVRFTATGRVVESEVHCWDAQTDEIGVTPEDSPATAPHLIAHPGGGGEQHEREYDPAELGGVILREESCPFSDGIIIFR